MFEVGLEEYQGTERVLALDHLSVPEVPLVVLAIESDEDRRPIISKDFVKAFGLAPSLFKKNPENL